MASVRRVNRKFCSDKLRCDVAHVGLYDVAERAIWIARKRGGVRPINISHARLLTGGSNSTGVADKDRFLCYWYHTPNTGEGLVHGYPIEWEEGHLMVRLDPNWDYARQELIASTDAARIERNIDQQFDWAQKVFHAYAALAPRFPLSWHMVGPRPADSMFYVERVEPKR